MNERGHDHWEGFRQDWRAEREAARSVRRESRRWKKDFGFDVGSFIHSEPKDDGPRFEETVERRFEVSGMARLRVRNVSGDTHIRAVPGNQVTLVAKKYVTGVSEDRAKRLLENVEVRADQHGDEIVIAAHLYEQDRGWLDLFRGRRVAIDFEIGVPTEARIDAHTVSGDLTVAGTRGPCEAQSVSGEVRITDVQGPLRLRTVSGDAVCDSYAGHCLANSVSGDLRITASRLRGAEIHSVSGDVTVDGELAPDGAGHSIKTISGDVTLGVATSSCEITFRTNSGSVEAGGAARVVEDGRRSRVLTYGSGAVPVHVKTMSGDLTVRAPQGESTPAPAPSETAGSEDVAATAPMQEPTGTSAREVLERLARGEIGVDDAAAALDAARGR